MVICASSLDVASMIPSGWERLNRRYPRRMADQASDEVDFEHEAEQALTSLPDELRRSISNVEIVIEEEPPFGQPLLGLYQGIPLTRRGSGYSGALPDKITIFRGPLERLHG